jgi:hypothetical protein
MAFLTSLSFADFASCFFFGFSLTNFGEGHCCDSGLQSIMQEVVILLRDISLLLSSLLLSSSMLLSSTSLLSPVLLQRKRTKRTRWLR